VNVSKSTITKNTAGTAGGIAAPGGGIFASGNVILINSTADNNSASASGGGGFAQSGAISLANSTVTGNCAGQSGGLLALVGSITLLNSTIDHNSAGFDGAGVFLVNCGADAISLSTIGANAAQRGGGLFDLQPAGTTPTPPLSLLHDTIAFNKAADSGLVSLQDTLAAQNKLFSGALDNFAGTGFTSNGHNLSDDSSGSSFLSTSLGDLFGSTITAGLSTTLSTNQGGKTKTYALLTGSKAIGAGDSGSLTLNQNGLRLAQGALRYRYLLSGGSSRRTDGKSVPCPKDGWEIRPTEERRGFVISTLFPTVPFFRVLRMSIRAVHPLVRGGPMLYKERSAIERSPISPSPTPRDLVPCLPCSS
jgi:hypothetical protein